MIAGGALLAASAHAQTLCPSAQLSSFKILHPGYPAKTDYCQKTDAEWPAELRDVAVQIASVHARVAALFGIRPQDLLPASSTTAEGMNFILMANPGGAIRSYSSINSVSLGVFSDWPESGRRIDESVYAHEFGHVISGRKNAALPGLVFELGRTFLFVESFADFVALGATSKMMEQREDFPACLSTLRPLSASASYAGARGTFVKGESRRQLYKCCDSLAVQGQHTEHSKSYCDFVKNDPMASPPAQNFDTTPLDPQEFKRREAFDTHLAGLPVNAFLFSFAELAGRSPGKLWVAALDEASRRPERHKEFTCYLGVSEETPQDWLSARGPMLSSVVSVMREQIAASELSLFDTLSKRHGLEVLPLLSSFDARSEAIAHAAEQMVALMKANTSATYAPKSPCRHALEMKSYKLDECSVLCDEK